uniref:Uncharacterized protein n=1 Tax=Anguilla anguilla TaxID=7936 RepID=A0A0E9WWU4_ANGAN
MGLVSERSDFIYFDYMYDNSGHEALYPSRVLQNLFVSAVKVNTEFSV